MNKLFVDIDKWMIDIEIRFKNGEQTPKLKRQYAILSNLKIKYRDIYKKWFKRTHPNNANVHCIDNSDLECLMNRGLAHPPLAPGRQK
ncbi:hypothetical protein [Clostridium estertheticum]|uniref:hypothetical protein n=1 Tax=Clostridium estertheticum TaxID=238834 RepID=UPI001C0AD00C|nr:hypothetical protein [Clostridium estertheticum]MBU3186577.1 hypothetical protein [Clostridium estertheticum]